MTLLSGRVAVVTGGARGIGLSIAKTFVAQGARVVLGDLSKEALDDVVAELGADVARGVPGDVREPADMRALLNDAVSAFGGLDVMVNNAGVTRDATMRKMSEEQFDEVVSVHLKGCWLGTKLAGEIMRNNQSGAIVNLSSLSGKVGMVGQSNYSAAKAGIVGLTKSAAKELARHQVRVNAVQPGLIRTPMTEAMPPHAWDEKMSEIPLGRAGEPDEVANVVLFLASGLSSYMTGTVLEVTGGRLM